MTQLDSITWYPQIFWLFISFGFFYTFVKFILIPLISEKREGRVLKIIRHYNKIVFYDFLNVDIMFKRFNVILSNF